MQRLQLRLWSFRTLAAGLVLSCAGALLFTVGLCCLGSRPSAVLCSRTQGVVSCNISYLYALGRAGHASVQPARAATIKTFAWTLSEVNVESPASPLLVGRFLNVDVFPFSDDVFRVSALKQFFHSGARAIVLTWNAPVIVAAYIFVALLGAFALSRGLPALLRPPGMILLKGGRCRIRSSSWGAASREVNVPASDVQSVSFVSRVEARVLRREFLKARVRLARGTSRAFSQVIFGDIATRSEDGNGTLLNAKLEPVRLDYGVLVVKCVGLPPIPIGQERGTARIVARLRERGIISGKAAPPQPSTIDYTGTVSLPQPSALPETDLDVFGLPIGASRRDVVRRHRELVLRHHPDRVAPGDRAAAHEKMLEIQAAYRRLLNRAEV